MPGQADARIMTPSEPTTRPDRVQVGDLRRTLRLFRRFTSSRKPYVAGVLLLMVEAGTAVVEPWPIAYLVDYLQGSRPDLKGLSLLPSARTTTILVLTVAIIAIAAANSAADSLTEVSKASALADVAAELGVPQAEVLAIGDGRNDIEMLRWAGRGVAMGQAPLEVQEAADDVTETVANDGVARELSRWFPPPSTR